MRVNHGRIQHYQTCPRLYYWRFIENLEPPRAATPLIVGKAVHAGLAAHYQPVSDHTSQVTHVSDHLSQEFRNAEAAERWLAPELAEMKRQEAYVQYIMTKYAEQYPTEPWTILAPEVEGSLAVGHHTLYFRTDAVVSWRNSVWLLEHKTTAQLGPSFFKKFLMDSQITTYIYGVWKTLGTRPLGAIINAIRKSRNLDAVAFERDVVLRSEAQLEEFVDQLCRQCAIIEDLPPVRDAYLMHTSQCVRFNRTCEYLDLCRSDTPQARELFTKRELDYVDNLTTE